LAFRVCCFAYVAVAAFVVASLERGSWFTEVLLALLVASAIWLGHRAVGDDGTADAPEARGATAKAALSVAAPSPPAEAFTPMPQQPAAAARPLLVGCFGCGLRADWLGCLPAPRKVQA